MVDRIYIEGHRPAMGWFNGNGFIAACDCGYTTDPQRSRSQAEKVLQATHLADVEQTATTIIEQDAVELGDEPAPDDSVWPEGF